MDVEVAAKQTDAVSAGAGPGSPADSTTAPPGSEPAPLGPRIEPCQFESLLQRAMEILNARHIAAQLGRPQR